jgi:RNA polymerase sigma factor (sigma-70 family)
MPGKMKEYTDSEIIDCLRNRQGYVVRYLSGRYMPMIRLMVTRFGGSVDDAQDVFQEGLLIMLEKIDDKNFVLVCKFKTLLFCVCENLMKVILKKRHAASNYLVKNPASSEEKDLPESIDNEMYLTIFRGAFETLDPVGKKILKLYWEDMSPGDIADKLGYSYGYVRRKKCEAQSELTEKVKRHPDYGKIINSGIVASRVVY